ncbi:MAG: ABC transporter permease [Proteobacteria bacterium]|nr:ABC transporter permease [Pseudomonadota bacterium]
MTIHPLLAALRRHKAGVVLIALQIALTLAIVCNAIFIIGSRIERIHRPTGLDESNLFMVAQSWVGAPTGDDQATTDKLDSLLQADLATLRNLPDVQSATPISSLPLANSTWSGGVSTKPDEKNEPAQVIYYFGGKDLLKTLGVKLAAGRDFTDAEIGNRAFRAPNKTAITIVSQAMADKLFPNHDALGKTIYFDGSSTPTTIIGIVERLQASSVDSWANDFAWNTALVPTRLDGNFSRYAVRAKPGRLRSAMDAAVPALYKANPMRVFYMDGKGVRAFDEMRASAYRADRGMAILMGVICLILLAVTGAGIVGLTSFWVGQRHKQIGVRRALGARKRDILRYFQTENLLIAGGGALAGIVLAIGLNLWLMKRFEMDRIPVAYVLFGVAVVLALGQLAVFAPARRAANVPPVVATRSV